MPFGTCLLAKGVNIKNVYIPDSVSNEMTIKTANYTRKQTTVRKSEAANYKNIYKVL